MTSYFINSLTPSRITKEEGLYLPAPTGINLPVAFNMNFDWVKLQPWSAFFLDASLCPESLPGTLHTLLDLRHPILKLTRCSGQIVMSWIFSGAWKQALLARISSISVSQPLNWSCCQFLWLDKFLEHDTSGTIVRDVVFDFVSGALSQGTRHR